MRRTCTPSEPNKHVGKLRMMASVGARRASQIGGEPSHDGDRESKRNRLGERRRRLAEDNGRSARRDDRGDEQRHLNRADGREVLRLREHQPDDAHDQDRHDAEQAIHQHRGDGLSRGDAQLRQAECAHDVAADAGGQKRSGKGADEEDPDDVGRAAGAWLDRSGRAARSIGTPSTCGRATTRAMASADPPEIGVHEHVEHGAGSRTPEHVRGDRDDEEDPEKPPERAKGQVESRNGRGTGPLRPSRLRMLSVIATG